MSKLTRTFLPLLLLAVIGPAFVPAQSPNRSQRAARGAAAPQPLTGYDAEYHIGLVANDDSPAVAEANTEKLNAALDAMHPGGEFKFARGPAGPIQLPIHFAAKRFAFSGAIKTNPTKVGGELVGTGGGYPSQGNLVAWGSQIGNQTQFVRILTPGEDVDSADNYCLLLRGAGTTVRNIHFYGRRKVQNSAVFGIASASNASPIVITTADLDGSGVTHGYQNGVIVNVAGVEGNTAANGRWRAAWLNATQFSLHDPKTGANSRGNGEHRPNTGTAQQPRALVGIGLEARNGISAGKHRIENCAVVDCVNDIRFLPGYYEEDGKTMSGPQTHADETDWTNFKSMGSDVGVLSENGQAVWHRFRGQTMLGVKPGGTLLRARRGGLWIFEMLIPQLNCTVLEVAGGLSSYGVHDARFDIHLKRDGFADMTPPQPGRQRLTLFKYAGTNPQNYYRWDIRITGNLAGDMVEFDMDPAKWVDLGGLTQKLTGADLYFDIYRLPPHVAAPFWPNGPYRLTAADRDKISPAHLREGTLIYVTDQRKLQIWTWNNPENAKDLRGAWQDVYASPAGRRR